MGLADSIQGGDARELEALAEFLEKEFDMREKAGSAEGGDQPEPVTTKSLTSALKAWAYMQLNTRDQGGD